MWRFGQGRPVLDCTVELMLEHGICFAHEGLLVFPSLFAPSASLVAWLVLARDFGRLRLSQECAEFEVKDGGLCGLRKVARTGGFAHVDVYFEDKTPPERRDEFISFVEDHLRSFGVQLIEHVAILCPCGHDFGEEPIRKRIARGDKDIQCPVCEKRHNLSDGAAEARRRAPELWGLKTRIERSRKQATREAVQLLARADLARPASRPIRLLHLSDLHFDGGTPVGARLQWLLDDVKRDKTHGGLGFEELDYLVVSGDFTDKACAEGFEKAYEFLSGLTSAFALSAERCILVPGNHDVSEPADAYAIRNDSKGLPADEWIQREDIIIARDPVKYPLRFKPFSDDLYHKFLQRPYSTVPAEQGIAIPFWETGIQFLTLNSCWEIDKFHRKRAGIHPEGVANAIKQAQKQVKDGVKSGQLATDRKLLRIAVWHHGVTAPDYKMKDLQFLGNLQKNGVKLALHGDVHEMRREVIGYWHERALHVTGAGSFGARAGDKGEAIPRLYNLLEIERDFSTIKVHTRCQETLDGAWGGYYKWPDPEGGEGHVAYYTIDLRSPRPA